MLTGTGVRKIIGVGEYSAIFSTFFKLPFVINIFVLSIFERPLKTGFTVLPELHVLSIEMEGSFLTTGECVHSFPTDYNVWHFLSFLPSIF